MARTKKKFDPQRHLTLVPQAGELPRPEIAVIEVLLMMGRWDAIPEEEGEGWRIGTVDYLPATLPPDARLQKLFRDRFGYKTPLEIRYRGSNHVLVVVPKHKIEIDFMEYLLDVAIETMRP